MRGQLDVGNIGRTQLTQARPGMEGAYGRQCVRRLKEGSAGEMPVCGRNLASECMLGIQYRIGNTFGMLG